MYLPSDRQIRIVIVDDHPVVCSGLTSMLNGHADLAVVGSASSGAEALALTDRVKPDLMLLDLRMPGMDGMGVLKAMDNHVQRPRVIILTSFEKEEDIYRAIRAGAEGYLPKDTPESEIIAAIRAVHGGARYIPHHVAARLADRMMRSDLTPREMEIIALIAQGCTNKQVGHALGISDNTVRHHVNSIMEKLHVSDRTEAVSIALKVGILPGLD